jgi:LacI family transcriptional regulator
VGLVFPATPGDLGDLKFLEMTHALSECVGEQGIDLLIIAATAHGEIDAYQRAIASRRVDAFVVARTRVVDARLEMLHAANVPFVAYGRSAEFAHPYAWFDFDNAAGAHMATQRLIDFGHRRLGYLGAPPDYNFAEMRFQGFGTALQGAGLAVDPTLLQRIALDRRSGYTAMQNLLAQPEPPSAVLVDNHLAGVGAVHAALQAGRVLGQDLSLIVYDGVGPDSVIRSPITSVTQPTAQLVGSVLAELLLARIAGAPIETLQRLRMPVLTAGESDGPPGGAHDHSVRAIVPAERARRASDATAKRPRQ